MSDLLQQTKKLCERYAQLSEKTADPAVIADRATFESPDLPPVGVDRVIVGGRTAVEHGRIVNERLGGVLRRPVR